MAQSRIKMLAKMETIDKACGYCRDSDGCSCPPQVVDDSETRFSFPNPEPLSTPGAPVLGFQRHSVC
jgi:hypothetical protein